MKKALSILLGLVVMIVCAQFLALQKGKEIMQNVVETLKSTGDVEIVSQNDTLFGSNTDIKYKKVFNLSDEENKLVQPVEVLVKLESKYILMPKFSSTKGSIEFTSAPYKDVSQFMFSTVEPIKFNITFDLLNNVNTDIELVPFRITSGDLNLDSKTTDINIKSKDNIMSEISVSQNNYNATMSGLFGSINVGVDNFKSLTKYDNGANFNDFWRKLYPSINDFSIDKIAIKGLFNTTIKDLFGNGKVILNSDGSSDLTQDLNIKNIEFGSMKLKNFKTDMEITKFDTKLYENIIEELYGINDYGIFKEGYTGKFAVNVEKLNLYFEDENDKKVSLKTKFFIDNVFELDDESKFKGEFSGEFASDIALSEIFKDMSFLIQGFEEKMISSGVLIKEDKGYKTKFKFDSEKQDIIFNDTVSLQSLQLE